MKKIIKIILILISIYGCTGNRLFVKKWRNKVDCIINISKAVNSVDYKDSLIIDTTVVKLKEIVDVINRSKHAYVIVYYNQEAVSILKEARLKSFQLYEYFRKIGVENRHFLYDAEFDGYTPFRRGQNYKRVEILIF